LDLILDTNAVSALLAGDERLEEVLAVSDRHELPAVVIGEYLFGILGSRRRRKLQSAFQQLEAESVVLVTDRDTAGWYASIRQELKKRGRPIPENDVWISALAKQHQLKIVSQDWHFDQVLGLERIGW
jgi:predicted nucleic acid-binding protein